VRPWSATDPALAEKRNARERALCPLTPKRTPVPSAAASDIPCVVRKGGRPAGSQNGRQPTGGYPDLNPGLGAFLAGFIEGEGSFAIRKQTGKSCYGCAMMLRVRADDFRLLRDLQTVTGLGTVRPQAARGNSSPHARWSVVAKADCMRHVAILDQHPLRGRKLAAYGTWRRAVLKWIGNDPIAKQSDRDWSPFKQLKRELHAANRYSRESNAPRGSRNPRVRRTDDLNSYIAGFVTAEGSFGVVRNGNRFFPALTVRVRDDDTVLLRALCSSTGVGRVFMHRGSPGQSPIAMWLVRRRHELPDVVRLFDAHPIRGRKAGEYAVWREAAILFCSEKPRSDIQAALPQFRVRLAKARLYRRPRELV
jgi:hypothetical protein